MAPDAGANDGLAETDLPDELLASAAHLHVAGYALLRSGSRPAARAAISRALERGLSVSVDPSSAALLSPEFLDHAHGAGLLLPNAEEAQMLSGERDPESAARALAARFSEVVVTLGADGALWTDGRRERALRRGPGGGRGGQHRRGRRVRRGAAGGASGRMRRPRRRWRRARGWPLRRWAGRVGGLSRGRRAGVYSSGEGVVFRRASCFRDRIGPLGRTVDSFNAAVGLSLPAR